MKKNPSTVKLLSANSKIAKTSKLEVSPMVKSLYKDIFLVKASPMDFAVYKVKSLFSILRPRYKKVWKGSISYLNDGITRAAQKISLLSDKIRESEMIQYWKDFIRGIPEYSALVRAKKFEEIENILTTLATHNEILGLQEDRIQEIKKAVKELKNESGNT